MKYVNMLLKVVLAGAVVHAIYFNDLPQYKNKAIAMRVIAYPLAALSIFMLWKFASRNTKKKPTYPHLIDICITAVVTLDLLGNSFDLYNKIDVWDDIMHFTLSIPWVMVFGLWIAKKKLQSWNLFALTVGYGAVTHIVWELFEYLSFVRSNPTESLTAYVDTIGDLVLSLAGAIIGAYLTTLVSRRVK